MGGTQRTTTGRIDITTAGRSRLVAKQVVRIFYDGFDYRGRQPTVAQLVHEGRAKAKDTYEAFTPEDVSKVFAGRGYRVEESLAGDGDDAALPMIRYRKPGTSAIVHFWDRLKEENLYARVRFEADVELTDEERQRSEGSVRPSRKGRNPRRPSASSMRSAAG